MTKKTSNHEETIEKLEKLLDSWQELASALKKEQEIVHRDFLKALDAEKMKRVLSRLKDIEE